MRLNRKGLIALAKEMAALSSHDYTQVAGFGPHEWVIEAMAAAADQAWDAGFEAGESEGYSSGFEDGVEEGEGRCD